jgi:hypothetical protein
MVQMSQRPENSDRHIALRLLRLLRRRRHRIESDVREKIRDAPFEMPPQPKFPAASFGGTKGCQFILATSG